MPAKSEAAKLSKSKVKRISFTLNNYNDDDERRIRSLASDASYLVVGRERCPTTGTRHLQGFINFSGRITFNQAKVKIGERAHLERTRGTDADNQKYCLKDGDILIEHGCPTAQGQRNDIAAALDVLVASGGCLKRVAEEHGPAYVKYHRGFAAYKILVCPTPPRDFKTNVFVYYGLPGSGKSRLANEMARKHDDDDSARVEDPAGSSTGAEGQQPLQPGHRGTGRGVYYKPRGQWWDGYTGQSSVVIDDFYGWIKYDELLKICDRYPHKVEIKGGYEEFTSKNIFITSNEPVDNWYKFPNYNPAAIFRRITEYIHFEKVNGVFIQNKDNNIHD
uniref:Replication-associated protein n=1 Tax=Tarsiger cyanurus CRESS-DNA-virus sp. TaxID=2815060 RepID=A0A8A4XB75_9VIRU|nr:MAG: replication-associated protein [Tarsiger cyanurus CRESS-DNA-virus sp.]